jgi:hypothetical protein
MRSCAAVAGLLLYLGSKALGLSVPVFLLHAITMGGAYLTGLVGALAPAAVGFAVAWWVCGYFNSWTKRRNVIGMRVLALVMSMVFFLYTDTYVAAFSAAHPAGWELLLPNLVFVLAVLLYAVFKFLPQPDAPEAKAAE